jgi:uncharacterized protein (TIGR02118 family)
MIRIAAVYAREKGTKFDLNYYIHTHLPAVQKKFGPYGLTRIEIDTPLESPGGGQSPFFAIGYLYFPSLAHFQEAYSKVGREVISDIVKYTDVKPMIQVGEVIDEK